MVLIESGIRMHTTLFLRDKSITPSGFCIKVMEWWNTFLFSLDRSTGDLLAKIGCFAK